MRMFPIKSTRPAQLPRFPQDWLMLLGDGPAVAVHETEIKVGFATSACNALSTERDLPPFE